MKVILFFWFTLVYSTIIWSKPLSLNPNENLRRLLSEKDTNQDKVITIDDNHQGAFFLKLSNHKNVEIKGVYFLSNLLQELKLATEKPGQNQIRDELIFENPADRISRLIRELYWDGLTRVIDKKHLKEVLPDSKLKGDQELLYIPAADNEAINYFKGEAEIRIVPKTITFDYLKSIKGQHGLLALKTGAPYVVPGGRFNEMYGWDSYFESIGLLIDGRVDLAKSMVDNFVYEINYYGKILNANRTYYLSRSQPPFLTSMIRAVYKKLPRNDSTKKWLKASLEAAIAEYSNVWMGKDHLTAIGLSRYYGKSPEVPPEVEPGHFDKTFLPFAKKHKLDIQDFKEKYKTGKISEPELDQFFIHDQAVRESGHDTTYRWMKSGKDSCADFVTVDLNVLLYKTELDIAYIIKNEFKDEFGGIKSADYYEKAKKRKSLIRKFLWNNKDMFYDFDYISQANSHYLSATAFYPLWALEPEDPSTGILTKKEAKLLIQKLLENLEVAGGLTGSSQNSVKEVGGKEGERQWDYPYGWAPHQMIAWKGLENYGHKDLADRLKYKWLYMITLNAQNYNGTIPEKYDVVKRSHKVFAEYGNVGTKFKYITREGFGWMNASYQLGLTTLPKNLQMNLRKLIPPAFDNP